MQRADFLINNNTNDKDVIIEGFSIMSKYFEIYTGVNSQWAILEIQKVTNNIA